MDVCVENVFTQVATPFNSFHDGAEERNKFDAGAATVATLPKIVHVRLDGFFAAVEQARIPKLRGKAVLVGNATVECASEEARARGVHPGMTMQTALALCPEAAVAAGDCERYAEIAERLRAMLKTFTPNVEVDGNDFYLDFTSAKKTWREFESMLREIQAKFQTEAGIEARIGAAATKPVAAAASQVADAGGVRLVAVGAEREFLEALSVSHLEPVGRGGEESLHAQGIATIGELRRIPRKALEMAFGEQRGRRMWMNARGLEAPAARKTPSAFLREATIANQTADEESVRRIIEYVTRRNVLALREETASARSLELRIVYRDGLCIRESAALAHASNDDHHLLRVVFALFEKSFRRNVPAKLAAVRVIPQEKTSKNPCILEKEAGSFFKRWWPETRTPSRLATA